MKADRLFEWITRVFAFTLVAVVLCIGVVLFKESLPALREFGWQFLFSSRWDPVADEFGALPFIYGTLASSLLALMMAVPLSLGIAIFLSELAPPSLRNLISFLTELLAAIPSVIYGLWGLYYLVPLLRTHVEPFLIRELGIMPLFHGPPYGVGMLAASIILAIMTIPIISAISRDVLEAVPNPQREAALALGATRWEVTKVAVLKYARSGIFGAIFLGLGRALGETMAVTMLIGNRAEISASLFAPAHTMASVIANEYAEASGGMHLSALSAIGLVLFVITFLVNALARLLIWQVAKQPEAKR